MLGHYKTTIQNMFLYFIIQYRFADTTVTSRVTNNASVAREAEFSLMIPSEAFIVNLTMTTENETIVGSIEEKIKAQKIYDKVKKTSRFSFFASSKFTPLSHVDHKVKS